MTNQELAKAHAKNKKQLRKAKTQIKLALNRAIKEKNEILEYVNIRLYFLLSVAWLESTLNFILNYYGPNIGDSDKKLVEIESSQESKWRKLIELSFRRQYLGGNKNKALNVLNLGHTNFGRYQNLNEILDNQVTIFIGIRNKLAHGQWAIALNNEGTSKQQDTTSAIWKLTKKDTILLNKHIEVFSNLIEFLVASKIKFEENNDKQIHKLERTKHDMETSYQWVLDEMNRRYSGYDRKPVKK